jgi:hypothetical protein
MSNAALAFQTLLSSLLGCRLKDLGPKALTTQTPLHLCFPLGHWFSLSHLPLVQPKPGVQRLLHLPQCSRLVFRSCGGTAAGVAASVQGLREGGSMPCWTF